MPCRRISSALLRLLGCRMDAEAAAEEAAAADLCLRLDPEAEAVEEAEVLPTSEPLLLPQKLL